MTAFLDWIILNPWAIASGAVAFAVFGYLITRPTAVKGQSMEDPSAWVIFCMGLFPDTRASREEIEEASDNDASSDSSD